MTHPTYFNGSAINVGDRVHTRIGQGLRLHEHKDGGTVVGVNPITDGMFAGTVDVEVYWDDGDEILIPTPALGFGERSEFATDRIDSQCILHGVERGPDAAAQPLSPEL